MIISINIKNSIICVIIIFMFVTIKSLATSTPNSKLALDASTCHSQVGMATSKLGIDASKPNFGLGHNNTRLQVGFGYVCALPYV